MLSVRQSREAMNARCTDQLDLAAVATAVSCARIFARITLTDWGALDVLDDAVLVVSELVTNAVKATGNSDPKPNWGALTSLSILTIRLVGLDTSVVIEVWDTSRDEPEVRRAGPEDDTGRGLVIVEQLSKRWGARPHASGKVVWAELPVDSWAPPREPRAAQLASPPVVGRARDWLVPDSVILKRLIKGLRDL